MDAIKYRPPGWRVLPNFAPRFRIHTQHVTDLATVCAVMCVLQTAWLSATASIPRAVLLHATTGLSKALSLILLNFLTIAQLFSCIILLVPILYLTIGLVVPSALLATSLVFHAFMFEVLSSALVFVRVCALVISFVFFATVRYDRSARNASQQLPTSDWILNWEEGLRRWCAKWKTGMWGLPLAVGGVGSVLVSYVQYGKSHGARTELAGDVLQLKLSVLSLLLLLISQDRKTFQQVQDVLVELCEAPSLKKHL